MPAPPPAASPSNLVSLPPGALFLQMDRAGGCRFVPSTLSRGLPRACEPTNGCVGSAPRFAAGVGPLGRSSASSVPRGAHAVPPVGCVGALCLGFCARSRCRDPVTNSTHVRARPEARPNSALAAESVSLPHRPPSRKPPPVPAHTPPLEKCDVLRTRANCGSSVGEITSSCIEPQPFGARPLRAFAGGTRTGGAGRSHRRWDSLIRLRVRDPNARPRGRPVVGTSSRSKKLPG